MKTIQLIWSTDDILGYANEIGVTITYEDAEKILDNIYHFHDASIGVNWDVIGSYIYNHQHLTKR